MTGAAWYQAVPGGAPAGQPGLQPGGWRAAAAARL